MKIRNSIAAVLLLSLLVGLTGCAGQSTNSTESTASELKPLRFGVMSGGVSHTIAVVGIEKGIFEKYGLDVSYVEFGTGVNTVDAVVTQQVDVGNMADYAIVNRLGNTSADTNLRIVGRFNTGNNSSLYVNPEKVSSLEDLKENPIVTVSGAVWDYWDAITLDKAGIAKEDQKIVQADSPATAVSILVSGDGAAFWADGSNGDKLKENGFIVLTDMKEIGLYTDEFFITSKEFVESNNDTLSQFLKASKEVEEWVLANDKEAAKIASSKIGMTEEQFLSDLATKNYGIELPEDAIDHLNEIKEWAVSEGRFGDYSIKDFVDTSALDK